MKIMGFVFALAAGLLAVSLSSFVPIASAATGPFLSAPPTSSAEFIVMVAPAIASLVFVLLLVAGVPARACFLAARRWTAFAVAFLSDLFAPRPLPSPS